MKPGLYAHFVTTEGTFTVKLFDQDAPKTVANFVGLAEGTIDPATGKPGSSKPFYNGLIFHRVIDGFMIQGGGMGADLSEKPTRAPIKLEAGNGLSNLRGTLAMARTADPDSATAQFFINVVDNPRLDSYGGGYAVFGKVVDGMEVVDRIKAVPVGNKSGHQNVPTMAIVIKQATLISEK